MKTPTTHDLLIRISWQVSYEIDQYSLLGLLNMCSLFTINPFLWSHTIR